MSDVKLQKISNEAWIVIDNGEKVGILNKGIQNNYTFVDKFKVLKFMDMKEVTQFFGDRSLFKREVREAITKPATFYIKGYPVDYSNPYPVEPGQEDYRDDVPLFRKTPEGDVLYCAGWYAIHFNKGWKHGYNPKLNTILKYGFRGPFKTELEARSILKNLNNG